MPAKNSTEFPTIYPPTAPTLTLPCDSKTPNDGWVADPADPDRNNCYHFSIQEKMSWISAQNKCATLGGSLVSVHSTNTNDFIVTNLNHNDGWIGYNSIYAGDWEWSDGSNVGYTRWSPGGMFMNDYVQS